MGHGDKHVRLKLSQKYHFYLKWVSNSYHVVYGLNLSMLDPMTLFAPESSPGDGALWVVLVRGQITRLELINWFMALPDGPDFSGNPTGLACFPVKAFRFEPIDPPPPKNANEPPPGILSMDAESVHFGSVQGRIMPQAGRLLVGEDV